MISHGRDVGNPW